MTEFNGSIGKLRLGYKVAQTLGWRWVLTRLYLEAEKRSGVLERRTPATTWDEYQLEGDTWFDLGGLHPEAAGECLRAQPPEVEEGLRQHLEYLKERHFDVFGTRVQIDDWHHDPIDKSSYPAGQHWSQIRELPDADLKLVWEPSRFGWAFDLARLHALDPSSAAPEVFWDLFEDWCSANQPFRGVNWKCGQEAALRLLAVLFAAKAFAGKQMTDERQTLLAKFADVTARRILAHWRYALSQDNNHIVSEAVGLIGVGLLLPKLDRANEVLTLGQRLLDESCSRLILPDGGTAQYSINYHRVFMDNLIWAFHLHRVSNLKPSNELTQALQRSHDFLSAITEKNSGSAGNWGNSDGSRILRLATASHLDMRPTLSVTSALLNPAGGRPLGPAAEAPAWLLGKGHQAPAETPVESCLVVRAFPDSGITVIANGNHHCIIRGGNTRFRVSHCDIGAVELWVDGLQVVSDPGTISYKADPALHLDLAEAAHHNAPLPMDSPYMTRLGRFLWSDAPAVSVSTTSQGSATITITRGPSTRPSLKICRTVTALPDGWLVCDENHCNSTLVQCHWCSEPVSRHHTHAFRRNGEVDHHLADHKTSDFCAPKTWIYRQSVPV